MPSQASISRVLTSDLGYVQKMTIVPKERLTDNAQERLDQYLTVCSACDPKNMHFFDESSVIKTTGNSELTERTYFTVFLVLNT